MSDISVIIPVYNRRFLIIEALNSVLRQTLVPDHVTIVDDGSTDGTYEAVQDWIQRQKTDGTRRLPSFQLLRQENSNAAAARQKGMSATPRTSFISFLDSDDKWPDHFAQRTVEVLQNSRDMIAVSTDRRFLDSSGMEVQRDNCAQLAKSPLRWMFRFGAGVASCTLFRWDAVTDAGGWGDTMESAEDAALFSRICLLGDWGYAPGDPVIFRVCQPSEGGEEGNLSKKFSDRFDRWATIYEQIFGEVAPKLTHSDRNYLSDQIGRLWYRAGKIHQGNRQYSSAVACFRKSLSWNSWLLRPRARLIRLACFPG